MYLDESAVDHRRVVFRVAVCGKGRGKGDDVVGKVELFQVKRGC